MSTWWLQSNAESTMTLEDSTMVISGYADGFWGGDLSSSAGMDALCKRNSENKKMCSEFEEYLRKRSKLEADYSKSLTSLSKCIKNRAEIGVLESSLNILKAELETLSKNHSMAADSLIKQADGIKQFKDELNTIRKTIEESLQKAHNTKTSNLSKTIQSEKTYLKKCTDRDNAVSAWKSIDTNTTPPKDVEKAKNKAEKAEEDAEKADSNYQSSVKLLEDSREQWENEMVSACKSVQSMDEKRIRFLRLEVWAATNLDSKLALDRDKSCENVRKKLETCDINSDIMSFLHHASTGVVHPPAFTYKHYTKISHDGDSNNSNSSGAIYSNTNELDSSPPPNVPPVSPGIFKGFLKKKRAT